MLVVLFCSIKPKRSDDMGKECMENKPYSCPLILAGKASHRLRGLLGAKASNSALLLMPCRDVHTLGMTHDIDVAFIAETGFVLAVYRDVKPAKRLSHPWAEGVIERFSQPSEPWFTVGEQVTIHA